MPVTHSSSLDKLLDLVPDLIEKTTQMLDKKLNKNKKLVEENVIVKVGDDNKNKENEENEEPSKTVKVESKPYDVEYDETDI